MSLFPHRARIGSTGYGLDADHYDHRSDNTPSPDLEVSEPYVLGVIWSPNGDSYREVLDRESVEFGFQQEKR